MDVGSIFSNPVFTGESRFKGSVFNVTWHFLCPADGTLDIVVINFRKIASAVHIDVPSRSLKQCNGCILKAPFGDAKFQW